MDKENDEVLPPQTAMDTSSRTSTSTENHNHNKVRRRNVSESVNSVIREGNIPSIDLCDRVPLVTLPDSMKAWHDDITPRIPDIPMAIMSNKQQNGMLIEDDREPSNEPVTTELFTNRERMKISVIRGSIINPGLTLGELRLLGCSSEGFVNGTLPR